VSTTEAQKAAARLALEALRDALRGNGRNIVAACDVERALAGLSASRTQPELRGVASDVPASSPVSGHEASRVGASLDGEAHPAATTAPLPVPGKDGCPPMLTDAEIREVAEQFADNENWDVEDLVAFIRKIRDQLAGQCVKLPEAAKVEATTPHPEYVRGYEIGWKAAQERYSNDTHAEPAKEAEPVMLWRAWTPGGGTCWESFYEVRVDPVGGILLQWLTPNGWQADPEKTGARHTPELSDFEKSGVVEYIGPGPDPREPVMPRCEFLCPMERNHVALGDECDSTMPCAREGCGRSALDPCHAREGEAECTTTDANAGTPTTTTTSTDSAKSAGAPSTSAMTTTDAAPEQPAPAPMPAEKAKPVAWRVFNPSFGEGTREARERAWSFRVEKESFPPGPYQVRPVYAASDYDALWLACEEARREVERLRGRLEMALGDARNMKACWDEACNDYAVEKARAEAAEAQARELMKDQRAARTAAGLNPGDVTGLNALLGSLRHDLTAAESRLAAMEAREPVDLFNAAGRLAAECGYFIGYHSDNAKAEDLRRACDAVLNAMKRVGVRVLPDGEG
jgi:hypothetical protein